MIKQQPKFTNTSISAVCIFCVDNLKTTFNLEKLNIKKSGDNSRPLLMQLEEVGAVVSFVGIESKILQLNLQYIDSYLPEIMSHIAYYGHIYGISKLRTLLAILEDRNPLNYNQSMGHPFYELKLKSFLTAIALGMTPETIWARGYDAIGETITIGDLNSYHLYNSRELHEYLLENAIIEQEVAENGEGIKSHKCGWVYGEGGEYFIKLNLQVRFT